MGATDQSLRKLEHEPNQAWAELFERFDLKLRVLLHCGMSPELRASYQEDDVVQSVWKEALQSIGTFRYGGPETFFPWLAGIQRIKMLELARVARRSPVPIGSLERGDPQTSQDQGVPPQALIKSLEQRQEGVTTSVRNRELQQRVQGVIDRLPAPEREVVVLKIYEGLTGREVARRLGVDEGTVTKRFQRALATCSIHLKEFEP